MKGLLTLDVLELPFGRRNNEVELRRIFGQGLEDQGEAQLLVGPGDIGGCRGHGDVLYTSQFLFAAFFIILLVIVYYFSFKGTQNSRNLQGQNRRKRRFCIS